jgi:L-rhamnose isomerase
MILRSLYGVDCVNYYCLTKDMPCGSKKLYTLRRYKVDALSKRG